MSVCLSICLVVCLFDLKHICLSMCMSVFLYDCMCVCMDGWILDFLYNGVSPHRGLSMPAGRGSAGGAVVVLMHELRSTWLACSRLARTHGGTEKVCRD